MEVPQYNYKRIHDAIRQWFLIKPSKKPAWMTDQFSIRYTPPVDNPAKYFIDYGKHTVLYFVDSFDHYQRENCLPHLPWIAHSLGLDLKKFIHRTFRNYKDATFAALEANDGEYIVKGTSIKAVLSYDKPKRTVTLFAGKDQIRVALEYSGTDQDFQAIHNMIRLDQTEDFVVTHSKP